MNSLKRGTGEAYIIAKEYPRIDFLKFIIMGTVKNFAYDGQSESSRAQYIFDIARLTNNEMVVCRETLINLQKEQNDTWNLTHLFDLAKIFAKNNFKDAKEAIYDRFLNHPIKYSDWVGYSEILELDGFDGMVYIAEKIGKHIEENPNFWECDSKISYFQEQNPLINVKLELEKLAKKNKYIKIYLNSIEENNKIENKQNIINFTNIIDEVLSLANLPYYRIKSLTDKDYLDISNRLLIERKIKNKEKLLRLFCNYEFPLDKRFILNIVKKTKPSTKIYKYALDALKNIKDEYIRIIAIEKISSSRNPSIYSDLLILNYQKGDYALLAKIAQKYNNPDILESLTISYISIYEQNKTSECKIPLEILYSKINCGIHRELLVGLLYKNGALSDKIKMEIQYDSYLKTREFSKTIQEYK